jgi:hypothetical protein
LVLIPDDVQDYDEDEDYDDEDEDENSMNDEKQNEIFEPGDFVNVSGGTRLYQVLSVT